MVSEVMEELYRIKQEIASEYKNFADFAQALLKNQAATNAKFAVA